MLNWFIDFSIRQRWVVILLTLFTAFMGWLSLKKLPIDAVPDISSKIVQVTTLYPSLSPIEVEKQIAFPLETAMAGIPGLKGTRSLTRNGFSQVEAVFEDEVDIYFARQQVLERLAEARRLLPFGAEPSMGPITTGLGEVFVYVLGFDHPDGTGAEIALGDDPGWKPDGTYLTPEGERLENAEQRGAYLRTLQDWQVRPQLRTIKEVAGVDTIGGYVKQYVVQPDPAKMVSFGISFDDLAKALEKNNAGSGAGFIEYKGEARVVRVDGRVRNIDDIGSIVVGYTNGSAIRVRDIASVVPGSEPRTGAGSMNGSEAVVGTVLMLLGGNSRTVSAAVSERMPEIAKGLPKDVFIKPVLVRTELVDKTIQTVEHNLFFGAVLVIVVLLTMLGNFRAAVITALAIPLSMLFTAIGMHRMGISANLMSLGAIDFGLIVDGAVIVVENCMRQLALRQSELRRVLTKQERFDVVGSAAKEVRSATAFGEAIIILVYFPILALTGVEGKMFHPMALTVICALAGAFVLSLTAVPAMVAVFMGGRISEKENPLVRVCHAVYRPILRIVLRLRWVVIGVALALIALAAFLFMRMGGELVPQLDEGNISLQSLRIPSTSLPQSLALQFQVEQAVMKVPEVLLMYAKTGTAEVAFDPMPPNISDGYVIFKPREQWPDPKLSKADVVEKIRLAVAGVPGNLYEYSQPIELRVNELVAGVRGALAVKVFGDEFEKITPVAKEVLAALQTVPGVTDAKMGATEGFPSMSIEIDHEALARYGLSVDDVQSAVAMAVGGRNAGTVFEGDRRFSVTLRLPEDLRNNPKTISNLPIPLPEPSGNTDVSAVVGTPGATRSTNAEIAASLGRVSAPQSTLVRGMIPLSSVSKITLDEGLGQINRENGKRRLVVQANVKGRDLGSFVEDCRRVIQEKVKLTPGVWLEWGGQYENLMSARERLIIVVPLCFLLIITMLYITFGSFKYAAIVFSGVPLALTGGVLALYIREIPFSISAAVGFIALSGVAVLNGLVMVTYIRHLHKDEGQSLEAAIEQGALTRLRPVLMTALVAALGFLPMAMASGTGAEVQRPLATVVIGGIVSAGILTLLVLPALYRICHRK